MTEDSIMHEVGDFWVARERGVYVVYRNVGGALHSKFDSAYAKTPDGLSIAIARAEYMARRIVAQSSAVA